MHWDHCIGFFDGGVTSIAEPRGNAEQNKAQKGFKKKHELKLQSIVAPNGLLINAAGLIKRRRHDRVPFIRSTEPQLENICLVCGMQHLVHTESGCNRRVVGNVPFQRPNLKYTAPAANTSTDIARVTVEWSYRKVKLQQTSADFKKKISVGESEVGTLYFVANVVARYTRLFASHTCLIILSLYFSSFE